MKISHIKLLILFGLLSVSFAYSSIEIRFPDHNGCPSTANILDFCRSELESCIIRKSSFSFCMSQFCDCSKTNLPSAEKECEFYILDNCRRLKNVNFARNESASHFEWPDDVKLVINKIEKECDLRVLNKNEPTMESLHRLFSDNQCVQNLTSMFNNVLMELDKKTSSDLPIPYNRFRCGWHYGHLGTVLSRIWINQSCGIYSVDFNHCCAIHLNCYLNQKGKQYCDDEFIGCRKKTVSRMTSYKQSCHSLISNEDHELFEPDAERYQAFGNILIRTKISSFDGNIRQGLTLSDIKHLNFSSLEVFKLDSDSTLDLDISNMFYEKIYKYGWSNRVIIDSCAVGFEECRRYNKIDLCLKQLIFCLYDIGEKAEEFKKAIREFNQTISSRFSPSLTKTDVDEMITTSLKWFDFIVIVQSIVLHFGFQLLEKLYEYCTAVPTPPNNAGTSRPLTDKEERDEGIPLTIMGSSSSVVYVPSNENL